MSLFEDAFSGFPAPAEGSTGGTGGAGSTGGEGGSSGGGANSGGSAPNLPDWFARLDALVTRGAENIPGFDLPPSEPGSGTSATTNPPPTVSSVEWDGFTHVQSGVYIGGHEATSDRIVRVVDGKTLFVEWEAAEAIATSTDAAYWTIADWDGWFHLYGNAVALTSESLAALRDAVTSWLEGFTAVPLLGGDPNLDPFLDDKQSLQSQKERLQSLAGGNPVEPQIYDVVGYDSLVAHARASLKSPSDPPNNTEIADAFIANYGYSGLLRLYRLEIEGSWNVAIRDLTVQHVLARDGSYVTGHVDGETYSPPSNKLIYVNSRELGLGTEQIGSVRYSLTAPPAASATEIAARVHAAIYDSSVSIHNSGVQLESTAAAALQSFLSDPKVRISLGILEVAAGWAAIPLTWGVAALPGVAAGLRGIDEIIGGLREIYNNEPNARSFTHKAVDLVTGDKSLTNNIVLAADIAIGGLSARQATKNAALKAEAKQAAVAARAGAVEDTLKTGSYQAIESTVPDVYRHVLPDSGTSGGLVRSRPRASDVDHSPMPLPGDAETLITKLYPGDTLPSRLKSLDEFVAGTDPRSGQIYVNGHLWDELVDTQKARVYFEEFKHHQRTLATPKCLRPLREMLTGEPALLDTYKFWEEFLAASYAKQSYRAGFEYAWHYPTISQGRIVLEVAGGGITSIITVRGLLSWGED